MAAKQIVARAEEQKILSRVLSATEPQLVAVYGRRRVGKTFLVNSFFSSQIKTIELVGSKRLRTAELLLHVRDKLIESRVVTSPVPLFRNWNDVFKLLKTSLDKRQEPILIFIDEAPWFSKPRSNFLGEFEHFWNTWGSKKENLKVILCGSATSWMLTKLIYNKEGLHNRFTARIRVKPFSLSEAKEFLESKKIKLSPKNLLEVYLSIGGVAQYLNWIEQADSAAVIVQNLCFKSEGNLFDEYEALIPALFSNATKYERVISALTKKRSGMSTKELAKQSGLSAGATLARILKELEENSFVTPYTPYKWGNERLHRLTDPYLLFYHKWIKAVTQGGINLPENYWLQTFNTQSFRFWIGYSYETFCFTHLSELLKELGISGIRVVPSVWTSKNSKPGAQVDLVLERADKIINICEIKYHQAPIILNEKLENEILRKVAIFGAETRTKLVPVPVLISASEVINQGTGIRFVENFGRG